LFVAILTCPQYLVRYFRTLLSQLTLPERVGPEPAPLDISAEFTSGGATTKFIAPDSSWLANLAYRPIAAGATMIGEPRSANNAPV
jgi:hypothetical protein